MPGASGAVAVACGDTRLRVCANACGSGKMTIPTTATTAAQCRKTNKPHPDIAFFLDPNHGNFMPAVVRHGDAGRP
jgi:hypothetical protein